MYRTLARRCTRICTRMMMFLLLPREGRSFCKKAHFPLAKAISSETKSDALERLISLLTLARLLIPPPWPVDFDCKFGTCDCKDRGAKAISLSHAAGMEHRPPSL